MSRRHYTEYTCDVCGYQSDSSKDFEEVRFEKSEGICPLKGETLFVYEKHVCNYGIDNCYDKLKAMFKV